MSAHDALCLSHSLDDCNCDAIDECKARTHDPLCPERKATHRDRDSRGECRCAEYARARAHEQVIAAAVLADLDNQEA